MMAKARSRAGRPESIPPELEQVILERLAREPVSQVFADPSLPERQTFYNHCRRSPEFFDASARARALRALVELDEAEQALLVCGVKATGAEVAILRERLHHARWKVSRMLSRYYGDKVALTGENGGPVAFQRIERVIVDPQEGKS